MLSIIGQHDWIAFFFCNRPEWIPWFWFYDTQGKVKRRKVIKSYRRGISKATVMVKGKLNVKTIKKFIPSNLPWKKLHNQGTLGAHNLRLGRWSPLLQFNAVKDHVCMSCTFVFFFFFYKIEVL